MSIADLRPTHELVSYYWNAYLDWRREYGVGDECMSELVAAIRAEQQRCSLAREDAMQLQRLAEMIAAELGVMKVVMDRQAA